MLSWLREFAATCWIALRRSNRDLRAQIFTFRLALFVAYLLAYAATLVYVILHSNGRLVTAVVYVVASACALAIVVFLRRSHSRENNLLNFSLTGQTDPRLHVSPAAEDYLAERVVILASLIARAASEAKLQNTPWPPGAIPVMRQHQNALLRQKGLWDKLEPGEAALAAASDASWTPAQIGLAVMWCEELRLLRWVLGMDAVLTPLEHFPKPDISLTHGLLEAAGTPVHAARIRKPGEIVIERDIALAYSARTLAEGRTRGRPTGEDSDKLRATLAGQSTDLLAGPKTIAELDDQALLLLGAVSTVRAQYAAYLVDLSSADRPYAFEATVAGELAARIAVARALHQ